jgi:cytosine/adenosine deaminase-related metal-dependent hydrolase
VEIDASGGIVMPGMIDTHRHMWQTALRGYGADWTLSQYFVFFYLEHGKIFRPQDIYAGNMLSAIESLDAGVTRPSTGRTACRPSTTPTPRSTRSSRPRPLRLAYGTSSRGRGSGRRRRTSAPSSSAASHPGDDMLGFQMAFDVTGDPEFPEKAAFEVARELACPVTTHAGVWGATNDDGIRLMHEHDCMRPGTSTSTPRR